jgi:hypothetical protein
MTNPNTTKGKGKVCNPDRDVDSNQATSETNDSGTNMSAELKRAELDQRAPVITRASPIPTGSLTVDKLSCNTWNYTIWSKSVEHFLATCSSLNLYFDGTILKPPDDQPIARLNWTINNSAIVGALYQWVDAEESAFLDSEAKRHG